MREENPKNDAVLKFGQNESLNRFMDTKPGSVHVHRVLGPCEVLVNIGDLKRFLEFKRFLNVEVFFVNA